MTVDIYLQEKGGNREIRFPILPEEFTFHSGDVMFISCDIMGRGEVATPSGTELGGCSWESEFPGAQRKNDAMIRGQWQDPKTYRNTLEDWKQKGTKLNLLITGYPVNMDVYINEFTSKGTGAFGDVAYKIDLLEARSITIKTTVVDQSLLPQRETYKPNTYTIAPGDSLWAIAERFYGTGTKANELFLVNQAILDNDARAHGISSSQNGHLIYAGTKITIP